MKHLLLLLIVIYLHAYSHAEERSETEMRAIALNSLVGKSTRAASLGLEKVVSKSNYCIYNMDNIGFVIVSKNKSSSPVLGISQSNYNSDNIPLSFKWWLNRIDCMTKSNSNGYANLYSSSNAYKPTVPLIKTFWGQGDPYNEKCPRVNGVLTPTGCVATAMAQIMNLYKYPEKGKGISSYTIYYSPTNSQKRTKVINSTYDWENMKLNYIFGGNVIEETAVQNLMFDTGAASSMMYSVEGSGTSDKNAALALTNNFSYNSKSMRYFMRYFYNDEEWSAYIIDELQNNRPILYGATDSIFGGHAFIIDGLNEEGLVHINWGWDGSCDGYYNIFDMSPIPSGTSALHFNLGGSMVLGIKPGEPDETDIIESEWCTAYSQEFSSAHKDTLVCSISDLWNYDFRDFSGRLYIVIENINGNPENTYGIYFYDTNSEGIDDPVKPDYGFDFTNKPRGMLDMPIGDIQSLPNGTYRVYFASLSKDEKYFQYIRAFNGPVIYTMTKNNGNLSVCSGDPLISNGIEGVTADKASVPKGIYNQNGMRMPSMQKGLNIIRQTDGTIKKVMMK